MAETHFSYSVINLRFSERVSKMVELDGCPCFYFGVVSKNPGKGSGHCFCQLSEFCGVRILEADVSMH